MLDQYVFVNKITGEFLADNFDGSGYHWTSGACFAIKMNMKEVENFCNHYFMKENKRSINICKVILSYEVTTIFDK